MKKILIAVFIVAISFGYLFAQAQTDNRLHFYALDIGQGDALLLRTPGGENILIDGGPGDKVLSELNDVLPFFDREIDLMYLTNPDKDHMEGLIHVIKKYPVKRVFFTGANKESSLYKTFLSVLNEKQIPITIADTNADLTLTDGTVLDILFPFRQMIGSHIQINNTSIMLKVTYGENTILFTGDAEVDEENEMVAAMQRGEIDLRADVLKAGHHGSNTSTTEDFLSLVAPELAVISCGAENKYGHPRPEVLARLKNHKIPTYRTDIRGSIEIIFSKEKIEAVHTSS